MYLKMDMDSPLFTFLSPGVCLWFFLLCVFLFTSSVYFHVFLWCLFQTCINQIQGFIPARLSVKRVKQRGVLRWMWNVRTGILWKYAMGGNVSVEKIYAYNTLRPRWNGKHFTDDIFKCIFVKENVWISIEISLKFVPKGPINNIPALVQIRAWRRPGDKPLSEPMMVSLLTHICVTLPQWVRYHI